MSWTGVYAVLSRSSRRRFEKALNKVIVSELYSQPRVAKKAEEMGLTAGSSFDLKNGYEARPADSVSAVWPIQSASVMELQADGEGEGDARSR